MTAHGGDFWVTSSGVPGEGCVFGMEMNAQLIRRQSLEYNSIDSPPSHSCTHWSSCCRALHVLVVKDSPFDAETRSPRWRLGHLGIENIEELCNGSDAVQAVEERMADDCYLPMFDAIFLNYNMDGKETAERIRRLGYTGAIVIVTDGDLARLPGRDMLASGTDLVLVRPLNSEKVAAVVQRECFSYLHEMNSHHTVIRIFRALSDVSKIRCAISEASARYCAGSSLQQEVVACYDQLQLTLIMIFTSGADASNNVTAHHCCHE
jgi:CheY-like chemotaxis protein